MNERIKKLSEKAEKYADDNFKGQPTWSEAFESKFAELIIYECAEIANSYYPPNHIGEKIKEYLGVQNGY